MAAITGKQMGFGDLQVPGPLAPLVAATADAEDEAAARVAVEVDLTYIAPPPGTPVPLEICADRARTRLHNHDCPGSALQAV